MSIGLLVLYPGRRVRIAGWGPHDCRNKFATVLDVGPTGSLAASDIRVRVEEITRQWETVIKDSDILPMTEGQTALAEKHGTPAEFAQAVYAAVPGDISMDEAKAALDKYRAEFDAASA